MTGFSRPARHMTLKYSLHQSAFWMAYCGLFSFAAAFLLDKGFTSAQTGIVLSLASLISCAAQPFVADFADRTKKVPLTAIMAAFTLGSLLCVAAVLFVPMEKTVFAAVYLVGALLLDAMLPLLNSLYVYYTLAGAPINYGVGRAAGSAMFGAASLGIGWAMKLAGARVMPLIVLVLTGVCLAIIISYPLVKAPAGGPGQEDARVSKCCSLPEFLRRYKWFCVTLAGVFFMASFHAMTENYLISILERLGGDVSGVGIALAIATVLEVPVLAFFSQIRSRLTTEGVLRVAAVSFLLKSVLLLTARSVTVVYLAQILQITSYGFCSPAQVFFASERISPDDMVKGQSFATASYALGCSMGSLLGGALIGRFGVPTMLTAGVGLAAAGVAVIFLTVGKKDAVAEP